MLVTIFLCLKTIALADCDDGTATAVIRHEMSGTSMHACMMASMPMAAQRAEALNLGPDDVYVKVVCEEHKRADYRQRRGNRLIF